MRRLAWTLSTDTGARAQPDESEMSRRRRHVRTDWIDWSDWPGWLDYWLEMSVSLAHGPVVTRNIVDREGKRTNSSRGGINHAQTAT
jgi:hypothetical protein